MSESLTAVTSERRLVCVEFIHSVVEEDDRDSYIDRAFHSSALGYGTVDAQVNHGKAFTAASDPAQVLNVPIRTVVAGKMTIGDKSPLNPKDPGIRFNSYEGLIHWIDPEDEVADLVVWMLCQQRAMEPTVKPVRESDLAVLSS